MKKLITAFFAFAILAASGGNTASSQRRTTPALSMSAKDQAIERRITALIAQMTLAEKLGQLQQLDGDANGTYRPEHLELARKGLLGSTLNVRGAKMTNELQRAALESRLKIPILLGFDVIHGYRTIFPVPLGEAASWDLAMMERTAAIAAAESRAAGVHWTFAPMLDIARDPRWGRIIEGAGEDVYFGSQVAAARVRGFQGSDYSAKNKVLATAKHWVGYGAAEAGRDYNTTNLSERALREDYFPPFKAAIDAGVGSFMTSFNDLDGVPATGNPWVMKKVLRDEWKFDGLVVSDYTAVMELMLHGLARTEADAAMHGLNAGTDMEMVSRYYNKYGEDLIKQKKVTMATIDNAVRHVLRIKFRLGLFDDPWANEDLEKREVFSQANREVAELAAEKSFVLLRNQDKTLPIKKNINEIAVIGTLANNKAEMNSNWAGDGQPNDPITVVEAIRQKYPRMKLRFEEACDIPCNSDAGFAKAVNAAKDSDFTVLVLGEGQAMSGEAASRSNIDLPGKQLDLVKAIHATGNPYAVVLITGRPLTINWLAENAPAILLAWFPGTMAGPAIVDTIFGDANPGGKLPITFPRSTGQIPIYYNHKRTGRPFLESNKYSSKYLDVSNAPQYPFGYGLSYTEFRLSPVAVSKTQIGMNESITASVDVTNIGAATGDEVVQLYIHDLAASVTRPVRELKGFKRITLQPGQKQKVEFTITPKDLMFLGRDLKPVLEPGEFQVIIGTSSDNGGQSIFEVVDPKLGPLASQPQSEIVIDLPPANAVPTARVTPEDDAFLEDMSKRAFKYLWDRTNPTNGLTLDRSPADGSDRKPDHRSHNVASIAASGFALTGYCIAADRGWVTRDQAKERARNTLDFFANRSFHDRGWFYHFVDYNTGERRFNSEISTIDTALLMGGVLTVRQCFKEDKQIVDLADKIYSRIDFKYMQNGHPYLISHGRKPETGFLTNYWARYSEEAILYLLAIGAPNNAIPANSWYAFERPWNEYRGIRWIGSVSPLFIHQFSHAWVDFRGKQERRPPFMSYFDNSINATRAQQKFFAEELSKKYSKLSGNMWGLTSSDSQGGYIGWGGPPRHELTDGSVVPAAPAGSLMFTPDLALPALKRMKDDYGNKVYGPYGFADAFNPQTGWVGPDVIGIDQGITLLSAENLRTGKVWYWFMQNDEVRRALRSVYLY